MTRSVLFPLVAAGVLASAVLASGAANALQVRPVPAAAAEAEKVRYYWRGYWGPRVMVVAPIVVPVCPARRVWVDTPRGPRLKWRRSCVAYY